MRDKIEIAVEAAKKAGIEILKFYGKEVELESKTDGSPLTLADCASHDLLMDALGCSSLPVVSEEGDSLSSRKMPIGLSILWMGQRIFGSKQ